jgi:hypothetical protein
MRFASGATPPNIPATPRKRTPLRSPVPKPTTTPVAFSLASPSQNPTNTSTPPSTPPNSQPLTQEPSPPSSPVRSSTPKRTRKSTSTPKSKTASSSSSSPSAAAVTPSTPSQGRKVYTTEEDDFIYNSIVEKHERGAVFVPQEFWKELSNYFNGQRSPISLRNRFYRRVNKDKPYIRTGATPKEVAMEVSEYHKQQNPDSARKRRRKRTIRTVQQEGEEPVSPIIHDGTETFLDRSPEFEERDWGGNDDFRDEQQQPGDQQIQPEPEEQQQQEPGEQQQPEAEQQEMNPEELINEQIRNELSSIAYIQENGGLQAKILSSKKQKKSTAVPDVDNEQEDEEILARMEQRQKRKQSKKSTKVKPSTSTSNKRNRNQSDNEEQVEEPARKKKRKGKEPVQQQPVPDLDEEDVTTLSAFKTQQITNIAKKTKCDVSVVLYALHICNGNVDQATKYLSGEDVPVWTADEDVIITTASKTRDAKIQRDKLLTQKTPTVWEQRIRYLEAK